jgi:uncharacterized membrane protein YhaH (DUF805 family)
MPQRIGRLELLAWFAATVIGCSILLVVVVIFTNTGLQTGLTRYPFPQAVCFILATVLILKAVVSRFHDIGWSGWAVLLMFVPLVDILALMVLLVMPGQKQPNAYGEPPIFLGRLRRSVDN